jgi:hypothetical protein
MAQACDPQSLLTSAACQLGCLSSKQLKAIQVTLLCAILNGGPVMTCDPPTLLSNAKCLMCLEPWQLDAIAIYLLCQILANGGTGGGGGSGVTCGIVDPVAAPTGSCGIYYRTDTGKMWVWDGAVWQIEIGGP